MIDSLFETVYWGIMIKINGRHPQCMEETMHINKLMHINNVIKVTLSEVVVHTRYQPESTCINI